MKIKLALVIAVIGLVAFGTAWKWSGRDWGTLSDGLSAEFRRQAQRHSDADKVVPVAQIGDLKRLIRTKRDAEIFKQIAAASYWFKKLDDKGREEEAAFEERPRIVERVERGEMTRTEAIAKLLDLKSKVKAVAAEQDAFAEKATVCRSLVRYALEVEELKGVKPKGACDIPPEALDGLAHLNTSTLSE